MAFSKYRQEEPHGTLRSIKKAREAHKTSIAKAEAFKDNDREFGRIMRTDVRRTRDRLKKEVELNRRARGK